MKRQTAIDSQRINEDKAKHTIASKESNKLKTEQERLVFSPDDEASFLVKVRAAARDYSLNGGVYVENVQAFKSTPSLPVAQFKFLFEKMFNVRYTYAELGVLLR